MDIFRIVNSTESIVNPDGTYNEKIVQIQNAISLARDEDALTDVDVQDIWKKVLSLSNSTDSLKKNTIKRMIKEMNNLENENIAKGFYLLEQDPKMKEIVDLMKKGKL
jgi:cell division protein YceG involved in septum cleavage